MLFLKRWLKRMRITGLICQKFGILKMQQIITMEDIKTIAERLRRMTKVGDQALIHGVFWDDLETLLNKILEEDSE